MEPQWFKITEAWVNRRQMFPQNLVPSLSWLHNTVKSRGFTHTPLSLSHPSVFYLFTVFSPISSSGQAFALGTLHFAQRAWGPFFLTRHFLTSDKHLLTFAFRHFPALHFSWQKLPQPDSVSLLVCSLSLTLHIWDHHVAPVHVRCSVYWCEEKAAEPQEATHCQQRASFLPCSGKPRAPDRGPD